jgi:hypothetical protein
MLRVSDCIADCVGLTIQKLTEWQHIGNQIKAAMIFMQELTKSAKPVRALAAFQPWILAGERPSLVPPPARRTLKAINSS